ncbi:hypothetical protein [Vallitalea guaymasensis]|uniref:Uncharacterized protein n=1 Tax=Vallitalea guaymasensis TaxID=1185412 RepID=A0A8J8SAG7_9FIRM|nr:hypothetical protein [Vallitalea guaymasensis]QUH27652.1 hypothetical protein HYG85_01470 [Vallitalea guaymasensis]
MIRNAPIWVNELLVDSLRIILGLLIIINIIFIIILVRYIIKGIYYKHKKQGKHNEYYSRKKIFLYSGLIIVTAIIISIFYLPREVLPNDDYSIYSMNLHKIYPIEQNQYNIKELSKLEELERILKDYKCKRSLFGTSCVQHMKDSKPICFSLILYNQNEKETLVVNFIIENDRQRVYTSANIDFVYDIENKDGMLDDKIYRFFEENY